MTFLMDTFIATLTISTEISDSEVYAARNLSSKRKGAVCQASVIFGIGKEKFRTEVVKSNDPTWNEENSINVPNQKNPSLILTVVDKEDTVGSITVPLGQIPSAAHKRRWLPLRRKHHDTPSDLCFDCWISDFKKMDNVWGKLFGGGGASPQEQKRRESIIGASTGIKGSTSVLDICSKSLEEERRQSILAGDSSELVKSPSTTSIATSTPRKSIVQDLPARPKLLPTLGAVMSMKGPPEITGISPRFGPSTGGTKIVIRGCNLGRSRDDYLGFFICGCECLDVLEFHSPAKLVCITKPWHGTKPNPGPIILVTKSGGRGVSTIQFEYQGKPVAKKSLPRGEDKTTHVNREQELMKEIEKLKKTIKDLTNENKSLKAYIDAVTVVLIEKFPEALEATTRITPDTN